MDYKEPYKSKKGVEVTYQWTLTYVTSLFRNSSICQNSQIQLKFQISERPKWWNTVAQNFSSRISWFSRMESQTAGPSLLQISGIENIGEKLLKFK